MPIYGVSDRFKRDLAKLTSPQRERFAKIVRTEFIPDLATGRFRPGLRVKRVRTVFEMTWAPDGRATWQYGQEQRPGVPHVLWRRVGPPDIFDPGPP